MKYNGCSYIYNGKDLDLLEGNQKEIDKLKFILKSI